VTLVEATGIPSPIFSPRTLRSAEFLWLFQPVRKRLKKPGMPTGSDSLGMNDAVADRCPGN
jgi:hypothetical protein